MTGQHIKELLCGSRKYFNMQVVDLREKIGEPIEVRILSEIKSNDGHQVVLMLIPTDGGAVEVFCPIALIDGRETVIDGWIGAEVTAYDEKPLDRRPQKLRGIDHIKGLFG